jgi:hypothetical protein
MEDLLGVLGFFASLYLWWFGGKRVAIQLDNKGWSRWFGWPIATAVGALLGLGALLVVIGATGPGKNVGGVMVLGAVLVAAFVGLLLLMRRGKVPSTATTGTTPTIPQSPSGTSKLLPQKVDILRPPQPAQSRRSGETQPALNTTVGMPVAPGATLVFDYSDSDGVLTRRSVRNPAAITTGGHHYIKGFCLDRGSVRTFRVDRIVGPVEAADTSERMSARRLFEQLTSIKLEPVQRTERERVRRDAALRERITSVIFVGFYQDRRMYLEDAATAAGWQVRSNISRTVTYVVAGSMAGERQLERASELGIPVITQEQFERRVS